MSLSPEEDDLVFGALLLVASPARSPRLAIIGPLRDVILQSQIGDGEPAQIVRTAMNVCLNDGNRLTPPALVTLLRIIELREPKVGPIIARLLAPVATTPEDDPFNDIVLDWNVPFLERLTLRQRLKALLAPRPAQPFVVVNGSHLQGKSYTVEFINHVLNAHPGTMPATISVTPKQGSSVGPAELASDLVARFGGAQATRPPKATNLNRWHDELVNWVTEAGHASKQNWWIVLDGFNADELRPDTAEFIAKLAKRMVEGGMDALRFRMILIDFDKSRLPVMATRVAQDTTEPVTRAQVQNFISLLFAGSAKPINAARVARKVMTGLPNPVPQLDELNEELTKLIATVRA